MKLFLSAVLLFCLALTAQAVTVTISENSTGTHIGTFTGVDDNFLKQNDPTANWGTASDLEITKYDVGDHAHTIIKFQGLSNLPSAAIVSSVTFGLWLETSSAVTDTVNIRRLLRNWSQATSTWNIWTTASNWTTGGALSDGNDRSATISGTLTVPATTGAFYTVTDASGGLKTDVQNWINGTNPNYGWHLEVNGTGNLNNSKGYSSGNGTNGQRPFLEVTYTVGGSSPVPVIMSRRRK